MKMTTVFLSIFLLAVSSITSAQTQVSGNVMGTWATSNSPYIVTGNLLVPEGDSLVIEPGVEVKFNGSFELRVQGLLRTEGAESDTVVFTRNHQDTTWYGIYFDNADDGCELRYTKIEYSRAYTDRRNGAGIYSINTNLLIRNCLIQHNYARSDGGGIFIRGRFSNGLKNQVIISSSKITNNTSRDLGGAIYCESAKLILSNSLISQNKGRADLYIFRSSFVFANNTVYDNTYEFSSSHPPSYLVSSDGSIINSILWEWGGFVNSNSDNVKIMYSAIEGGFEGEGNIDSNPLFVDPQNGEFSLQVSSPCINAGHPSALFNDIDGSGNDMGTSGGSGLLTDPLNVEFGPAGKGQNRREVVYIHNFRDTPVRITSVSISDEDNFSAESVAPFDIQSFSLDSIAISFHPVVFKTLKEQLILESPDLFGASSAQIDLHGEAGIFSGVVSGVWNFQDSPFILHGNVLVEGGKTLVVEPGVQLRFRKGSSLEVPKEAGLFAKGTKDSMITFTSDEPTPFPGDWNGIILKGTENRVEIKYCQIEYATTGITCRAFTSGCNSYDNYATIENCQIQFNSGHGILLTGSGSSSGCTIPRTGHCNPNIRFNWIHSNDDNGIKIFANDGFLSGGYVGAEIFRNVIAENRGSGIDCSGDDNAEPKIINNTIYKNSVAGIRFLSNFNANEFIVTNNIVSQNGTGIHSVENATASSNYNDVWGNSVDLQGLASSTADISLDPLFIDAPNGDFHLQPNSPAIDAGNPTRPKDSDNTIADMGAFPYLQKPATPILISPADSSEGVSSNATLSWNSAERASNYDIQLARTDSFKVMVLEQYALSGTMFTVSGLKANETYFWRVRATNIAGDSDWSDVWKFKVGTPTAVRMGNDIPAEFSLNQNYPSPFNPSTTIEFSLPRSSHVILKIFNIRGEEIETLVDNDLSPGTYNVAWNGEKMGSGTYFYRIRAGEFTGSRRMTVIR